MGRLLHLKPKGRTFAAESKYDYGNEWKKILRDARPRVRVPLC